MASISIPRGVTEDWLGLVAPADLGSKIEVIEGPNLKATPDNLTQATRADGTFLQEDASRRRVAGIEKIYIIDDAFSLPVAAGQVWSRQTNLTVTAAPYKIRIDEVNVEGQTEDGYKAYSIAFHYFEDIASGTLTEAAMTTSAS